MLNSLMFFVLLLTSPISSAPTVDCEWRTNLTHLTEFMDLDKGEELADCLYYYLLNTDFEKTSELRSLHETPPPEHVINITIDEVLVRTVELAAGSSYQFNIYGKIYMDWPDSRLKWDEDSWHLPSMYLADHHRIWTPHLVDTAICPDETLCRLQYKDINVMSDGLVSVTAEFRHAAFCEVDFAKYPEEENNCCIFFTAFEPRKSIHFLNSEELPVKPIRPVVMQQNEKKFEEINRQTKDHSAWILTEHTVSVIHLSTIESSQVLKICTHAQKKMSTIRVALRLPVTIATLLMLVSPLFGDLRTQSFVKIVTLTLQTLCFLYLCSIAPPNGFAGVKPKIYRFYESVFAMTALSMVITVGCMALSRARRTVPPTHRLYLAAKLVNRTLCCIEPDQLAHYLRYVNDNENQGPSDSTPDYTQDWRHIYLAVNNLSSGLFFTTFTLFMFLDLI
ncbi:unnamed protein product [Auanema sp. JU1783]|nr:unnamed protein product [Auanema sp. JU1783]